MLRKLTLTLTLVLTSALVLASSAFAVIPADSLSGGPATGTGTSSGFPWFDVTVGVALAVVGVACLAGVATVNRNRRHSAALQA
jgi:hypothetical protein